jgi:hydrogenase maturation protease
VTTLVIGCGNADRGDDGVGLAVARSVEAAAVPGVRVVTGTSDPASLMELWADVDHVIVVDAASSGGPPGTVRRLDPTAEPVPARPAVSSHGLGPAEAVELARALGRLPARIVLYAIEAEGCAHGAPLSPAVAASAPVVAEEILTQVRQTSSGAGTS